MEPLPLWPLYPIRTVDLIGSAVMIGLSILCLRTAGQIYARDPENPFATYILWFCIAVAAFAFSRSLGHILRHILDFSGHGEWWRRMAPVSGAINTMTFVVIASVTLFFRRMRQIMNRMAEDRARIEKTGQALLQLNEDIEAIVAERTEAEMALRVAHEIRNPVTIIGGLIRRIVRDLPREGSNRALMERVLDQAEKLELLVARFEASDVSPRHHFSTHDLNVLVEEVLGTVEQETQEKRIVLLLDRSPNALRFHGNRHFIKAAILHVLRNAMDACGPGDTIELSTAMQGRWVAVDIQDSGPGITGELLDHIFDAFYTTKEGATGLGLSYVRQIVEEHKGTIEIESDPGQGTTVHIRFPAHPAGLQ